MEDQNKTKRKRNLRNESYMKKCHQQKNIKKDR